MVNYNWDFDGGMVVLGMGFGLYWVIWDMDGDKIIFLMVMENGCISEVFM